jgi:hypothetical protein
MTKKRKIILAIGLIFGVLGFASKLLYRPLIIGNNLNDIGINEFAPSFFYTVGVCLIGASFSKKKPNITMIFIALGSTAYELEQMFTSYYFDIKDLFAIIGALLVSLFIFKIVEPKGTVIMKNNP